MKAELTTKGGIISASLLAIFLALTSFTQFTPITQAYRQSQQAKPEAKQRRIKVQPEAPPKPVKELPPESSRYALLIGINDYEDPQISPLEGAVNDAKNLKKALIEFGGFREENITLLTSDQPDKRLKPTRSNILNKLSILEGWVPKDGLLLFAFSGHGVSVEDQAFLLPMETSLNNRIRYLMDNAVSVTQVRNYINDTGVRQRIMLLDACRTKLTKSRGIRVNEMTEAYKQAFDFDFEVRNRKIDAFVTLYATETGYESLEDTVTKQGYFTGAVIEALRGGINHETINEKGEVTLGKLIKYVHDVVTNRTMRLGVRQVPFPSNEGYGEDLVIAKVPIPKSVTPTITNAPTAADLALMTEMSDYKKIKDSPNPEDWKAFLKKYPKGMLADIAKDRLQLVSAAPAGKEPENKIDIPSKPMVPLVVIANAPAASVIVKTQDGKTVPLENKSGNFYKALLAGVYDVKVTAANYQPYSETIKLEGEPKIVSAQLVPLSGSIILALDALEADSRLQVLLDNKQTNFIVKSKNEIELRDIPKGVYRLRVKHPSISDWEDNVEVTGGVFTRVKHTFVSAYVTLTIKSQPGAKIYVGEKYLGSVASSGEMKIPELRPGEYTLKASLAGFNPSQRKLTFSAGTIYDVDLPLTPEPKEREVSNPPVNILPTSGILRLSTNAATANVVIKNQSGLVKDGQTANGIFSAELPPGVYNIDVSSEKYSPSSKEVIIKRGETATEWVSLTPNTGSIILVLDNPIGLEAEILVDNQKPLPATISRQKDRIELKDIRIGSYRVQIKHTNAGNWESEKIDVQGGSTIQLPVRFNAALASLIVKTEPGADIFVDGNFVGKVKESGKIPIQGITPGKHIVKAVKDECEYKSDRTLQLSAGPPVDLELPLARVAFSDEVTDSFINGASSWTAPWQAKPGEMMVRGPDVGFLRDRVYKDFRMVLKIKLANDRGAAWIVRARDEKNYYVFQLSGPKGKLPKTFSSFIVEDGVMRALSQPMSISQYIKRSNESFRIFVDAKGSEIRHSIIVDSAPTPEPKLLNIISNATTFSCGKIGFRTIDNEETIIQNVFITPVK